MVAFDVTEEESINSDIEHMNHFLDVANTELVAAVENAREVSRNEAILRMRSRVHDTVGQRLSILHRYLEDDDPDPEKLACVVDLARTVVEDLAEPDDIDAEGALRAIESSFSLVGIVLGVMAKWEQDRFHVFSWLGIVLNLLVIAGISFILYAGVYGL